jgi:hypothetical protein
MRTTEIFSLRLTPEERDSIEALRNTLQEKRPYSRVSLAEALRFAVSSATASLKEHELVSNSQPDAPIEWGKSWRLTGPEDPKKP